MQTTKIAHRWSQDLPKKAVMLQDNRNIVETRLWLNNLSEVRLKTVDTATYEYCYLSMMYVKLQQRKTLRIHFGTENNNIRLEETPIILCKAWN